MQLPGGCAVARTLPPVSASSRSPQENPLHDRAMVPGRSEPPGLIGDYLHSADDGLRRIARIVALRRRPSPLRTTSVVHETYLRLAQHRGKECDGEEHFLAIATRAMRQVLVDLARHRNARKRGGERVQVPLDERTLVSPSADIDVIAVDEGLRHLSRINRRAAQIVELRVFGGLSVREASQVLGVSPATVKRSWRLARAWLHRHIEDQPDAT